MGIVWHWITSAVDRLTGSMDNGSFFSRPWRALYAFQAIVLGAGAAVCFLGLFFGGFVTCFKLYGQGGHHAGVQAAQGGILLSLALLITGLLVARIWWVRGMDLAQHMAGSRVFIAAPIVAHLVRTWGEATGVFYAVGVLLVSLAVWPFFGTAGLDPSFAADLTNVFIRPLGMSLGALYGWPLLLLAVVVPVAAYFFILFTRWIAECIEVFFAIANNTRSHQSAQGPSPQATRPTLSVDAWSVVAGVFCYLLLAFPLHQWFILFPAITLLVITLQKEWSVTAALLIAVVAIVVLRTLFTVAAGGDPSSVAQEFIRKGEPLHILLLLLVLAAIVTALLEAGGRALGTLKPGQVWSIGLGIALLHGFFPATHAIAEAVARHELTASERAMANELFKPYQHRPFGWRTEGHVDTVRTFTVGAPTVQADKYGMITVTHELQQAGGTMRANFTCSYKAIRLPGSLTYEWGNTRMVVQYMNGDSILFHEYPAGQRLTAVALDAVRDRHAERARQRTERLTAFRDSLNQVIDTLTGVFVSYDCVNATCFAWFDVERPEGKEKRSFYCPSATVNGYPVSAMPKDGAIWTIVTRESIIGTEGDMGLDRASVVYELIALRPAIDVPPVIVDERLEKGPELQPTRPAARKEPAPKPLPTPKEKVYRPDEVDHEPVYQGGRAAMRNHLAGRHYPAAEKSAGITGKVQVSFIVAMDGSVRDVRVDRSPGYVNFDNEAKRIVGSMPSWRPGLKDGAPVDVRMTETVDFSLNE